MLRHRFVGHFCISVLLEKNTITLVKWKMCAPSSTESIVSQPWSTVCCTTVTTKLRRDHCTTIHIVLHDAQATLFSMMRKRSSHDAARVHTYNIYVLKVERTAANPDTARHLLEWRTRFWTASSEMKWYCCTSTLLLVLGFMNTENLPWLVMESSKMKSMFVGDRLSVGDRQR
jgi:hypothetical protein